LGVLPDGCPKGGAARVDGGDGFPGSVHPDHNNIAGVITGGGPLLDRIDRAERHLVVGAEYCVGRSALDTDLLQVLIDDIGVYALNWGRIFDRLPTVTAGNNDT
jgi:hypothetical protein